MTILNIIKYPDKRLREKAKKILNIKNYKIQSIINNMLDTMYYFNGIGLSAPQVNINKQIIIINITNKKNNEIILINPIILSQYKFIYKYEGCLSIPNFFYKIKRYKYLKVEYINRLGNKNIIYARNIFSICIQHEIDHLKGKLFIDYLSEKIFKKLD